MPESENGPEKLKEFSPLLHYRLLRGLKQKEVALRAGITQGYYSKLENEITKLSQAEVEVLRNLCLALDVSPNQLMDYSSIQEETVLVMGQAQAGVWRPSAFWDGKRHYPTSVAIDERYPNVKRFGLEIFDKDGRKHIAYFVPIETDIPLEVGVTYLVQRRNKRGEYEMSIRKLSRYKDGSLWLEFAGNEDASPADTASLSYKAGAGLSLIARVSAKLEFV